MEGKLSDQGKERRPIIVKRKRRVCAGSRSGAKKVSQSRMELRDDAGDTA